MWFALFFIAPLICSGVLIVIMIAMLTLTVYILANIESGYLTMSIISKFFSSEKKGVFFSQDLSVSIHFALGSAFLSSLWLCLGLGGILYSWLIWLVLITMSSLVVWRYFSHLRVHNKPILVKPLLHTFCKKPMYLILLVLSVCLMSWFGVLAYVRPQFGDPGAFYMVYAKIIAATGQITAMPGMYHDFSSIGLSGELHDAALMAIGTPAMAKFFAWIAGLAILMILKDLARSVGGGLVAQVVAVMILLTSTSFTDYLSDGKTDVFPFLLGIAAVYSIIGARESQSNAYILISGLLTGFALTAKFSFIICLLPAVLTLFLFKEFYRDKRLQGSNWIQQTSGRLMLLGLGILIASLPHLLKNLILFDNPFVPFFGMQSNWTSQSGWFSLKDTLWIIVTYPVALVFGLYPLMGGNISMLWLAAIPLIFFIPRSMLSIRLSVVQLTLSGLVGLLFWMLIQPSIFVPRYFLSTFMMLIPLPSLAVEYIWQHEFRPRIISACLALVAAMLLLITPFVPPAGVWTALPEKIISYLSNGSPECGLELSTYCDGFASLNDVAKKGDRVYVAGYHTYWLRSDLLQCINEVGESNLSATEVWTSLYENGFMHIAVQKPTHRHILDILDPSKAPTWLKVSAEFINSDMPIFHLKAIDSARHPKLICRGSENNIWKPLPYLNSTIS